MTAPPQTVHPGVASDAIAGLVRGPRRRVRVLAAFRAAVYLAHDDGVVALVAADGVHHPNALVDTQPMAASPFAGCRAHQHGWVGQGQLVLPRRHLRVTRWFDPTPRLAPVTAPGLAAGLARGRVHVAARSAQLPDDLAHPLQELVGVLAHGDRDARPVAARLLGRGPGLTPAGDDVLAGLLAATPVVARAVPDQHRTAPLVVRVHDLGLHLARIARDATTAVSAALLAHAVDGAVAAPAAEVLHALAGRGSLPDALDRLLAVGSTSGRDLATGLLAGTSLVLDATVPRPTPART